MARDDTAALLEQQIPALRRYAYALVRDPDAADDLVQDCLERALSRWSLRRPDGELRAWLFAILRNLYLDRYRQLVRRGRHVELDTDMMAQPATQEAGAEMGDVLAALQQLPEEQQSVLLLVGVEDFSYEEAARALGLPVGTVMSRLSRGRSRLRAILENGRGPTLRRVK
ncbi:sigma-70 family RNA polymerase sigma factor [Chelatococcus reniformis]|uniref:RNA polymerase sigma factor n=1 Tax=Chelatococcus reniformis TaxID=1494448 RepID=A0A916U098_9HYPH|nr:sigma-70 family RNA polymerase sigma factor [Chelatococcus reniformis]GGC50905.1 RNA polymerase sigma factor [Chelatococcus reniformis]